MKMTQYIPKEKFATFHILVCKYDINYIYNPFETPDGILVDINLTHLDSETINKFKREFHILSRNVIEVDNRSFLKTLRNRVKLYFKRSNK